MITEKTKDVETIVKGMKQLKIELDEKTKRSKTNKGDYNKDKRQMM